MGVAEARNTGLRAAKGNYNTFVDSDDWIHYQFFELMIKLMIETGADLCCCNYETVKEKFEETAFLYSSTDIDYISQKAMLNNHLLRSKCWGKLYRKELIEEIVFPSGIELGEDTIFVLNCLQRIGKQISIYKEKLYYYFNRLDSAIHRLDETALLHTVDYYLSVYNVVNDELCLLYLVDGIKKMLACRYEILLRNKRENKEIKECNDRLGRLLQIMKLRNHGRDWYVYLMFYKKPCLYRLYRIIVDPTMLKYERTRASSGAE